MTNLSIVSQDEVSENQVKRSNIAKTQHPDAEGLIPKTYEPVYFYFFQGSPTVPRLRVKIISGTRIMLSFISEINVLSF